MNKNSQGFMAKARQVAERSASQKMALAIVPLTIAALDSHADPISTDDMTLDASYAGYWNASGFFTEAIGTGDINYGSVPDGTSVGGAVLGEGFKLFGTATMNDNRLGQIGSDRFANFGNEAFGLGFGWTGGFIEPIQEGDRIVLDYEFSITFTDNVEASSGVFWELSAGIFDNFGSPYVPMLFADTQQVQSVQNGSADSAGTTTFTGTIESEEVFFDESASYQWAVFLTTDWGDDDAFMGSDASGDTLTVTIPQNSIDIGLNEVPVGAAVPAPLPWALFGLAGFSLLFGRSQKQK